MVRMWEAEYPIDAAQALEMIQTQFPTLAASHIKLIGIGWDNTAFLINDHYVFRFPRRQIAVPWLRHESCMLPKLSEQLPLPIPNPSWVGMPSETYPWPFSGYEILKGRTACHVDLSIEQRIQLAKPLASFLKALHSSSLDEAEKCGLPGDIVGRLNVVRLAPMIQENLQEIAQLRLLDTVKPLQNIVEASMHLTPKKHVLVHGDFYVRHFLIDEDYQLSGIIDWGDIHIGDPAIDLSVLHAFLPPEAHDSFFHEYGQITEDTWHLARLRALHSSANLVVYGHHTGDIPLVREGMRGLIQMTS